MERLESEYLKLESEYLKLRAVDSRQEDLQYKML